MRSRAGRSSGRRRRCRGSVVLAPVPLSLLLANVGPCPDTALPNAARPTAQPLSCSIPRSLRRRERTRRSRSRGRCIRGSCCLGSGRRIRRSRRCCRYGRRFLICVIMLSRNWVPFDQLAEIASLALFDRVVRHHAGAFEVEHRDRRFFALHVFDRVVVEVERPARGGVDAAQVDVATIFTFETVRLLKIPRAWLVMIPLRASMSVPPRTTPLVRFGLSPSSWRLVIVTLSAWTRMMLLAVPPQSEPGEQTGFDVARVDHGLKPGAAQASRTC